MHMEVFTAREVTRALPMSTAIDLMEAALKDLALGQVVQPLRTVMRLTPPRMLGLMPAWLKPADIVGTKLIAVVPGNAAVGLPSHQGVIVLFAASTGTPLAVVDAESITAIRTAAVSGVATRHLARPSAQRLALLGTGRQARTHLAAMLAVRPIRDVWVWGRNPEHAQALQRDAARTTSATVRVAPTAEEAAAQADIICTVTSAATPVLAGRAVQAGTHINAVGACLASDRELDTAVVQRSRLFADQREACAHEAGDYLIPLAEGAITERHLLGELGEVIAGTVAGRTAENDVTVFKAVGLAAEDIAAAHYVYASRLETPSGSRD